MDLDYYLSSLLCDYFLLQFTKIVGRVSKNIAYGEHFTTTINTLFYILALEGVLWIRLWHYIQGDQLYMVVFVWYFVKMICPVYTTVHPYTGQVTSYKVPETHSHV